MYSRYNKDKTCLSSKTPTCLIFKTLTFILYDSINHPNIMGARCSCGKSKLGMFWFLQSRRLILQLLPLLTNTLPVHSFFAFPKIRQDVLHDGLPIITTGDFSQATHDQLNNQLDYFTLSPRMKHAASYLIEESGDILNYVTWVMRLTWGKLLKQKDWHDRQNLILLQQDQYFAQGVCGDPRAVTSVESIFNLVWTYNIEALDVRKKAGCTCDGSPHSGTVWILDETYANCVEQTSSCLFYAISAVENLLIYGADVSNTFA
jgi:hypothetical protein